jgi:hypothetical protein
MTDAPGILVVPSENAPYILWRQMRVPVGYVSMTRMIYRTTEHDKLEDGDLTAWPEPMNPRGWVCPHCRKVWGPMMTWCRCGLGRGCK